jgi:hypothetical protein
MELCLLVVRRLEEPFTRNRPLFLADTLAA